MTADWIVDCALKATLLFAITWGIAAALRSHSASLRHLVWLLGLAAALLLPAVREVAPEWTSSKVASRPAVAAMTAFETMNARAEAATGAQPHTGYSHWILLLWAVGCALVAFRWIRGALRTQRLRERAAHAEYATALMNELRVRAPVRVLKNPDTAVALVWGLRQPSVILPVEAAEWEPQRLRAVLAHELAHVKRWDLAAHLVAQITCAVYWFHPLAWLAFRRMRQERERACDDAVLSAGINGSDYAGYLIDLVRTLAPHPPADAPAMAEARDLELRVRAVLNPKQRRSGAPTKPALAMALAAIALVFGLGSFHAVAQSSNALIGTVEDPSGARIARALVRARNVENQAEFVATADPAGAFAFATLPPGTYAVQVSVPGFETYQTQVTLSPASAARVDARLVVGSTKELVTISARGNPGPAIIPAPVRIRIGGNVQPGKAVFTPPPVYPESLQQRGIHGYVVVRAIISKEGQVVHPQVVNLTEADPELAAIALETVRSWTYTPSLLNGEPVETLTTITMNFHLAP
jgi:TonB family protein